MQALRKKLTEKIDETQVDLQAIRASIDTQTRSLLETVTQGRTFTNISRTRHRQRRP
jgi:hypothetical protein